MSALLRAGADKISVNSSAVADPDLLAQGAELFGSQCIVGSVDAAKEGNSWRVFIQGGRTPTELDGIAWAIEMADRGAGEILLTSMDRDGVRNGYDLELTRKVSNAVFVPVIASGGAGLPEHLRDAFVDGGASAALVAGILHDGLTTVSALKRSLSQQGVLVR
jgi:cyclase